MSSFQFMFEGLSQPRFDLGYRVWPFIGASLSLSHFQNVLGGSNVIISASVFKSLRGFSEYVDIGYEDFELYIRAIIAGFRHSVIPQPLLYKRNIDEAVSMLEQVEKWPSHLRVMSKLQALLSRNRADHDLSDLVLYIFQGIEEKMIKSSFFKSQKFSILEALMKGS
jgi:GT2 family glycosyltransferase